PDDVRVVWQVFRELRVEKPGSARPDAGRVREKVTREDLSGTPQRSLALRRVKRRFRRDMDAQRWVTGTEAGTERFDRSRIIPEERPARTSAQAVRDIAEPADLKEHAAKRQRKEEREFHSPS